VREIRRILFIRSDRLGDVLMNLPAFRVLRKTYPKAWITLLADRSISDLFNEHPDIDELISVNTDTLLKDHAKQWELLRKIRAIHFDLGVASNPCKFFHQLLFLSGIPIRVGWRRKWAFCLNRSLPDTKGKMTKHEIDSNLDLVGLVSNEKWDGQFSIFEDKKSMESIRAFLGSMDAPCLVAVHPGTSNPEKRWGHEKFVELCKRLQSIDRCQVVLIGGEEETALSRAIAEQLPKPALDLTGKLKLKELAALFKELRVKTLVSSDSGPVHVAWMSGTPVVALYAKNVPGSDPKRWGPRDGKSEVIFKEMDEISVEEVWERVKRFV